MKISYNIGGILGIEFVTVDYKEGTLCEGRFGELSKKSLKEGLLSNEYEIVKCADNTEVINAYAAYFCKNGTSNLLRHFTDGLRNLLRSFLVALDHEKTYHRQYSNSVGTLFYVKNIVLADKELPGILCDLIYDRATVGYTDALIFVHVEKVDQFVSSLESCGFKKSRPENCAKFLDMYSYSSADVLFYSTVFALMRIEDTDNYVGLHHDEHSITGQLKELCTSVKENVNMRNILDILGRLDFQYAGEIADCFITCKGLGIEGDYLYIYALDDHTMPEDVIHGLLEYLGAYEDSDSIPEFLYNIYSFLYFDIDQLKYKDFEISTCNSYYRGYTDDIKILDWTIVFKSVRLLPRTLSGNYGVEILHKWGTLEDILNKYDSVLTYEFKNNEFDYLDDEEESRQYMEQGVGIYDSVNGTFTLSVYIPVNTNRSKSLLYALVSMLMADIITALTPTPKYVDSMEIFGDHCLDLDDIVLDGDKSIEDWLSEFFGRCFNSSIKRRILMGEAPLELAKNIGLPLSSSKYETRFASVYNLAASVVVGCGVDVDFTAVVLAEILARRTTCTIDDIDLQAVLGFSENPNACMRLILVYMYKNHPAQLALLMKRETEPFEVDCAEALKLLRNQ